MNLKGAIFHECRMHEVDFFEAQLVKSSFRKCSLEAASFNKANLTEADFSLSYGYFIDVRHTKVTKAKFSLPEAVSLLHALEIVIGP